MDIRTIAATLLAARQARVDAATWSVGNSIMFDLIVETFVEKLSGNELRTFKRLIKTDC